MKTKKVKKELCMRLYLYGKKLHLKHIPFLPDFLRHINKIFNSCIIPYSAEIHPDACFGHGGLGCVIHEKAVIREGVYILQGVTIGGRNETGGPIIEKNVFIGANATILGKITIGKGAKIGANALVITDVPEGATAVGVPARIIVKKTESKDEEHN